jgi:hypothetical protein
MSGGAFSIKSGHFVLRVMPLVFATTLAELATAAAVVVSILISSILTTSSLVTPVYFVMSLECAAIGFISSLHSEPPVAVADEVAGAAVGAGTGVGAGTETEIGAGAVPTETADASVS